MTDLPLLTKTEDLPPAVQTPVYKSERHATGIVHIGTGAFFRAHLAVYTEAALAQSGGNWRIIGISPRSTQIADQLNAQNGLYTVLTREGQTPQAQIIGSLERVIPAHRDLEQALLALSDQATRIVSLTVTEKAYGIDRSQGGIDDTFQAIAHDLITPKEPQSIIGMIVEALRRRRDAKVPPFTVLCCDNLPDNGGMLKSGVIDFAARINPSLATWIADQVPFPSTMVDRITPASTPTTYRDVANIIGLTDMAAVETEPFKQWIIEDQFPHGRPSWEAAGAVFVDSVTPYEDMKLRLLNGAHSLIAYTGFLSGYPYVRDVMQHPDFVQLVRNHFRCAIATLDQIPQIDLSTYCDALIHRFANPAIAHQTYQIAMDGTEKLPQRLLIPTIEALANGTGWESFSFTVAAWMRYCLGTHEDGSSFELRDPRQKEIAQAVAGLEADPAEIVRRLHALPGLFPAALKDNADWSKSVGNKLAAIMSNGMQNAIKEEISK